MSPEKLAAVLEVIAWMNKNSLFWATAGHIPAYTPVTGMAEYKAMQPNATYSSLAETAVFDPSSTVAGVASPTYDATLQLSSCRPSTATWSRSEAMELARDED